MSASKAKVLSRSPLAADEAKWTRLVKVTWQDPHGKERIWESAERPTRSKTTGVDAVGICAILEKPNGPEILLQKQFRPAVDKVCIEVPAGLIDEGETVETSAARELKEETGYIGEVIKGGLAITPLMFNDPGFTNTNVNMVHVSIDMSLPENQNPQPQLEPGEFIECFTVPLKDLYQECRRLEQEGYGIDARVGTMAEGIEIARQWNVK